MAIRNMGYLGFSEKDVPAWRSYMTDMLGMVEVDHSDLYRMDSVCLRWGGPMDALLSLWTLLCLVPQSSPLTG